MTRVGWVKESFVVPVAAGGGGGKIIILCENLRFNSRGGFAVYPFHFNLAELCLHHQCSESYGNSLSEVAHRHWLLAKDKGSVGNSNSNKNLEEGKIYSEIGLSLGERDSGRMETELSQPIWIRQAE